ncbi:MAG: type I-C CRISPR-associated protein Cas8c/Csd1 [Paraprevotella sp.]|nr:type I-C CRISPR-associated protein Cas8c/Csd1 [Paraprevotella sp.]
MILKALYDYYNRCDGLAERGLELKEIGYLIVLDNDGTFIRLESRMKDKKTALSFFVLQAVKRSGRKYSPNYFWDNYEYVVGGDGESAVKHKTFVDKVSVFKSKLPNNEYVNAVSSFFLKYKDVKSAISDDVLFDELVKSKKNISFLIQGKLQIAAEDNDIINLVLSENDTDTFYHKCLVTGKKGLIARLHTTIKLSKDTGPLVAFKTDRGYDSYGKEQGRNAPISEEAEFAYTTALNHLLRSGSHNKFMVGSRTFLFWASSNSEAAKESEDSLFALFGRADEDNDDPNKRIKLVRDTFMSIYTGKLAANKDDRFFILGLAPNSARIAVVYWNELPLREFAGLISKHFTDMEIVDTRKDKKPYVGLHSILGNVTLGGKSSDATPNLPDAVVKSIFQGLPYPASLFQACIRRIRAEQSVNIVRAAIIKAYLNRLNDNNQNKKLDIMLDKENQNQGYLCGRLFAVLDKIQEDANNIHSIRERYMNAASATPATVFATILNLSTHHLEKLNEGKQVFYEKLKQEIIAKLDADGFPAHLDLQDQGRFFVGYYHQRQAFFVSKENKEAEE